MQNVSPKMLAPQQCQYGSSRLDRCVKN